MQSVSASAKEKPGEKHARRCGGKAPDHVGKQVPEPTAPGTFEKKSHGFRRKGGKRGKSAQKARDKEEPKRVVHGKNREPPRENAGREAPDKVRGERSRRESADASETDREEPPAKRAEGRTRRDGGRALPRDARHDGQSAAMSASTSSGFVAQLVTNRTT